MTLRDCRAIHPTARTRFLLPWMAAFLLALYPCDVRAQDVLGEHPDHTRLVPVLPVLPAGPSPQASGVQAERSHRVRVIYFLPSNREPQAEAEKTIQRFMLRLQTLLRENMARLGYPDRTFALELENGVPKVHVARSSDPDSSFHDLDYVGRWVRILNGVNRAGFPTFSRGEALLIFAETHRMLPDGSIDPATNFVGGAATQDGHSGVAVVTGDFLARTPPEFLVDDRPYDGLTIPALGPFPLAQGVSFPSFEGATVSSTSSSAQGAAAHELGHAFGLPHDFRNDENFNGNLMGNGLRGFRGFVHHDRYPRDDVRLSSGSALWLNFSPFLSESSVADTTVPQVQILDTGAVAPVDGLFRVRVHATDIGSLAGLVLIRDGNAVADLSISGSVVNTTLDTYDYTPGVASNWEVIAFDLAGNRVFTSPMPLTPSTGFNRAPVPKFNVDRRRMAVGESVLLDATPAFDPEGSNSQLQVEWDVDGDGVFDTLPSMNRTLLASFVRAGTYQIVARITDGAADRSVSMPLGMRVVPPLVNHLVAFVQSTESRFFSDATSCPAGYAGRFSFDATLTNVGADALTELSVEVASLTQGNLLLVGDELLEPQQSYSLLDATGSTNFPMPPGESMEVPFTICLERKQAFQLFVNVRGTPQD